ncbi:hypothetical protein Glove_346g184 [Diversispora epigaea]|uniref:Disintegrin and metalloproteinase domain-containing protein B n=1 Tax=Diversispora epigaea TaxID=1348612 RepID=A0A397HJE2_9GLOM|nr:hypothetical protein Glove_346g184 [Diversispora epigaea]
MGTSFFLSRWRRRFSFILLLLSLFTIKYIQATSFASRPLTYLEFVGNPKIEIYPRDRFSSPSSSSSSSSSQNLKLRHDDSMRIQFIAFNKTFNLHLEPNIDLFHPKATITIHHADKTSTTKRLVPNDYRIYKGFLLDTESTDRRLNEDIIGIKRKDLLFEELSNSVGVLGWARISVLDDGNDDDNDGRKKKRHPTFEGTFSYKNELYNIHSIRNFKISQHFDDPEIPNISARPIFHRDATMVIYRDSDKRNSNNIKRSTSVDGEGSCALDSKMNHILKSKKRDNHNHNHNDNKKRDNGNNLGWMENPWFNFGMKIPSMRSTIQKRGELYKRETAGCPLSKKIAYMGAAADCTYVQSYGSSEAARTQILKDWTTASAVYERSFNVTLGLIKLEIQDLNCPTTVNQSIAWNRPCSTDYSINNRLSDFSKWRGTLGNDGAALWHLMSKCNTDSKVGVAWLGQLCQYTASQNSDLSDQSFVSGTGVSTITKDEWKVVAHEIGHGFGASHDCIASLCPCINCSECCPLNSTTCDANGLYIMNPTSDVVTNDFSPCSLKDICAEIPTSGSCLVDPSESTKTIIIEAMCGNGLKESGEECDCGSAEECANDPCCDGSTCKLKSGALCDDKNDMCCENCKYMSANTTCRPAISECDITETCDGKSGVCPTDQHKDDGVSCGSGSGLACASGQCTSRDNQCLTKGAKLGATKACPANTETDCTLRCANPNDSTTCYELTGTFVDGTPCGFGGKCSDGKCINGSIINTVSSWFDQNKKILIPVGIAIGFLISLCFLQCIYKCCRRSYSKKVRVSEIPSNARTGYSPGGYSQGYNNLNELNNDPQWVDPTPYNGPSPAPSPTQDLPDYYHSGVSSPPYGHGHNDRRNISPSPSPYPYPYPYSQHLPPDIIPPYSSNYGIESPSRVNSPAPSMPRNRNNDNFVDHTYYNGRI